MTSKHKNQKKPIGSRLKKRKPSILIGAVLVAIATIFLYFQDNSDPTLGSSDKPYLVPAPPETPMDLLDDPNADGWPTEALAEEAKQQLKGLGKSILNPGEIKSESLRQFVSDDVTDAAHVPRHLRERARHSTRPPLYPMSAVAIGPSEPGGWPLSSYTG